jgi:hypothetical protein
VIAVRATWRRLTAAPTAPAPGPRVIEGEFHVVRPAERRHLVSR